MLPDSTNTTRVMLDKAVSIDRVRNYSFFTQPDSSSSANDRFFKLVLYSSFVPSSLDSFFDRWIISRVACESRRASQFRRKFRRGSSIEFAAARSLIRRYVWFSCQDGNFSKRRGREEKDDFTGSPWPRSSECSWTIFFPSHEFKEISTAFRTCISVCVCVCVCVCGRFVGESGEPISP